MVVAQRRLRCCGALRHYLVREGSHCRRGVGACAAAPERDQAQCIALNTSAWQTAQRTYDPNHYHICSTVSVSLRGKGRKRRRHGWWGGVPPGESGDTERCPGERDCRLLGSGAACAACQTQHAQQPAGRQRKRQILPCSGSGLLVLAQFLLAAVGPPAACWCAVLSLWHTRAARCGPVAATPDPGALAPTFAPPGWSPSCSVTTRRHPRHPSRAVGAHR